MSQAPDIFRTHRAGGRALVAVLAAWACFAASSAGAQTLSEYSRSQRAVLEAEMARNVAKAMAPHTASGATPPGAVPPGGPHASTPMLPPSSSAPMLPPQGMPLPSLPAYGKEILVTGVIALTNRSMAELSYLGETYLLLPGDSVPGTSWVVASIDASRVVLKSGRSRTRSLPVTPTGGR